MLDLYVSLSAIDHTHMLITIRPVIFVDSLMMVQPNILPIILSTLSHSVIAPIPTEIEVSHLNFISVKLPIASKSKLMVLSVFNPIKSSYLWDTSLE